MNCRKVIDCALEFLDGTLGEAEGMTIEAHLQECPLCRAEIERLRTVQEQLRRAARWQPPIPPPFPLTLPPRPAWWQWRMATRWFVLVGLVAAFFLGWGARCWLTQGQRSASLASPPSSRVAPYFVGEWLGNDSLFY